MIGTSEQPLRVAIVGSGPAGFYTAEHVLKHEGTHAEVDMFDRLADPLRPRPLRRRAGPSQDQVGDPRLREDRRPRPSSASSATSRSAGTSPSTSSGSATTRVVFAYGTATDRQLGIPGEDLPGSHPATEFVNWYNAHPDFADREFDLSCERVVVIGNGNVAADVARMLALTPDELGETDTADHAIEAFAGEQRQGDRGARSPRAGAGRVHQP